jgi:hypothetical protein
VNDANQLRNQLHQVLTAEVGNISPKEMFKGFEHLRQYFEELSQKLNPDVPEVEHFISALDRISTVYEDYLQSRAITTGLDLVVEAGRFTLFLKGYSNGLAVFTENYVSLKPALENEREFSLLLPSDMDLSVFVTKLVAVEKIYKELCTLNNVSFTEYPLKISKVESGSLLIKVFGETKVVELFTDLVRSSAKFLYRKYTSEGKIETKVDNAESISSVLELRERLAAAGIDVSEMDDHLRKASVVVAKDLNVLLDGQSEIIIEGEVLPIRSASQERLGGPSVQPRIGYTSDDK